MRLVLSYVVSNASWSSAYDVRVFTKNKAMKVCHAHRVTDKSSGKLHILVSYTCTCTCTLLQVQYYGLIQQSTGEDWENASISLSTAQPSIGGSAPALPTKIIRFVRPRPIRVRQLHRQLDGLKTMAFDVEKELNSQHQVLDQLSYGVEAGAISLMSAGKPKSKQLSSRRASSPPPSPPPLDVDVATV